MRGRVLRPFQNRRAVHHTVARVEDHRLTGVQPSNELRMGFAFVANGDFLLERLAVSGHEDRPCIAFAKERRQGYAQGIFAAPDDNLDINPEVMSQTKPMLSRSSIFFGFIFPRLYS